MRLGLLAAPLLTLSLGCSFSSQGEPDAGDEVANTGSETASGSGGEEIGTDQGTSADSTGDGDATTTTTDEGTTNTTTETTDTTETSTDTTESSTDSSTDTSTDTTTDTSTDTTTDTGMMETYYQACPNGGGDCAFGEVCKEDLDLLDDWQVCALPCNNSGDCPDGGGLPLTCISYGFQEKACHIDCDNNDCPLGMSCKSVNVGIDHICAW